MGQDTSERRKKPFQYARGAIINSYTTDQTLILVVWSRSRTVQTKPVPSTFLLLRAHGEFGSISDAYATSSLIGGEAPGDDAVRATMAQLRAPQPNLGSAPSKGDS